MQTPSQAFLQTACDELARRDTALSAAYRDTGLPDWRRAPACYETLARLIVSQQISTHAAASIWRRITAHFTAITPDHILDTEEAILQSLGLSRPKIAHLKSIAQALHAGDLNLSKLALLSSEAARAELQKVKGIGPWTAELYVLYVEADMDAWPVTDLGLLEAYRQLSGAETRLDRKAFTACAEAWRPWRGVAAHLLWAWLNAQRAKKETPAPSPT